MFRYGVLLFNFVFIFESVQAGRIRPRIYNGEEAKIQDYPYMASIRYNDEHFCGGSIISDKHILTAAHCFNLVNGTSMKVLTGTSRRNSKGSGNLYEVDKVDIHPEWNTFSDPSLQNDIAVITLKSSIKFNEYQQKINLPREDVKNGAKVTVTGWGLTLQFPPTLPENLLKLNSKIIISTECQKLVQKKIYTTQFCTLHGKASGVCQADSGGPLAVNNEVIGIVSWGVTGSCGEGLPEIHTNVYAYKDFINSIIY